MIDTIISALKADPTLNGYIADRIYRKTIPQEPTYPLLVLSFDNEPVNGLSGQDGINIQGEAELYGKSQAALESIKDAFNSVVYGLKGVCTGIADDSYQDDLGNYSIFIQFSIWE